MLCDRQEIWPACNAKVDLVIKLRYPYDFNISSFPVYTSLKAIIFGTDHNSPDQMLQKLLFPGSDDSEEMP